MKKTTKFLLVLAAVVAMTIGAVSTVMAADDVQTIAKWGDAKNGWDAFDANGNQIQRGWAVDPTSNQWYFFNNYVMTTNNIVTTDGKIYFLGGDGVMTTGWVRVNDETECTLNYDTKLRLVVGDVFEDILSNEQVSFIGNMPIDEVWEKGSIYAEEGVWMYFNADGSMAVDTWINPDGVWYYMDGPFCVMNETAFLIDDGSFHVEQTDCYGFGRDGAMLIGWQKVQYDGRTLEAKPYQGNVNGTFDWVYYGTSEMTNYGWEKIGDKWYYFNSKFNDNGDFLYNYCLLDKFIYDGNSSGTKLYYVDGDGVMATGVKTVPASKNRNVDLVNISDNYDSTENDQSIWDDNNYTHTVSGGAIYIAKNGYEFNFDAKNGLMLVGATGNKYYNNGESTLSKLWVEYDQIKTDTITGTSKTKGIWVKDDFFYRGKIDNKNNGVHYYDDGLLVKKEAIKFANTTILLDANGTMITDYPANRTYVSLNGVKYVRDAEHDLTIGDITLVAWKIK